MPATYIFPYTFLKIKKLFLQKCSSFFMREDHRQNTLIMQHCPLGRQVAKLDRLPAFLSQHLVTEVRFTIWKKSGSHYIHMTMVKYGQIYNYVEFLSPKPIILMCPWQKNRDSVKYKRKNLVREGGRDRMRKRLISCQLPGSWTRQSL